MKINDHVFMLESTKGAYAYLVMDKELTLIDTGFPWQRSAILKELAGMGVQPGDLSHILLTHHDLDHIGNAAALQELSGAQLWASAEDIPYITGVRHRPSFKKYLPYIIRVKKPHQVAAYGDRVGGVSVIPTPGHTPGHVCLLYEDILFAGDLVKNYKGNFIPYPSGWNWNDSLLRDSIKRISQTSYAWICPAHGRPVEEGKLPLPTPSPQI